MKHWGKKRVKIPDAVFSRPKASVAVAGGVNQEEMEEVEHIPLVDQMILMVWSNTPAALARRE